MVRLSDIRVSGSPQGEVRVTTRAPNVPRDLGGLSPTEFLAKFESKFSGTPRIIRGGGKRKPGEIRLQQFRGGQGQSISQAQFEKLLKQQKGIIDLEKQAKRETIKNLEGQLGSRGVGRLSKFQLSALLGQEVQSKARLEAITLQETLATKEIALLRSSKELQDTIDTGKAKGLIIFRKDDPNSIRLATDLKGDVLASKTFQSNLKGSLKEVQTKTKDFNKDVTRFNSAINRSQLPVTKKQQTPIPRKELENFLKKSLTQEEFEKLTFPERKKVLDALEDLPLTKTAEGVSNLVTKTASKINEGINMLRVDSRGFISPKQVKEARAKGIEIGTPALRGVGLDITPKLQEEALRATVDLGSFGIPVVGEGRFVLEVLSSAEKIIKGKPITPGEIAFTAVAIIPLINRAKGLLPNVIAKETTAFTIKGKPVKITEAGIEKINPKLFNKLKTKKKIDVKELDSVLKQLDPKGQIVKVTSVGLEIPNTGRSFPLFVKTSGAKTKGKINIKDLQKEIPIPRTATGTKALLRQFSLTSKEKRRIQSVTNALRSAVREKGNLVRNPLFNLETIKNKKRSSKLITNAIAEEQGIIFGSTTTQQLPKGFKLKAGDIDVAFPTKNEKELIEFVKKLTKKLKKGGEKVEISPKNPLIIQDLKGGKVLEAKAGIDPTILSGKEFANVGGLGFDFANIKAGQPFARTVPFGKAKAIEASEQQQRKGVASLFLKPSELKSQVPPKVAKKFEAFLEAGVLPKEVRRTKDIAGFIVSSKGISSIQKGSKNPIRRLKGRNIDKSVDDFLGTFNEKQQKTIQKLIKEGTENPSKDLFILKAEKIDNLIVRNIKPRKRITRASIASLSQGKVPKRFKGSSPLTSPIPKSPKSPLISPKVSPKISPKPSPKPSPKVSPKISPVSKVSPKVSPTVSPIPSPVPSPKVSPKITSPVSPKIKLSPALPSPIPSKLPKATTKLPSTLSIALKKLKKQKGRVRGWQLFVKKEGKFRAVGKPQPKHKAIKRGAKVTRSTLSATFATRPTSTQVKGKKLKFTPSKEVFRNFKRKGNQRIPLDNTWIQKRGKRLGTRSEVGLIQQSKRSKRRRKIL